jgi:hypothetical protein
MSVTETSGHGMFSLLLSQLLHHRDSLTAGYNSSGTYFHTAIASYHDSTEVSFTSARNLRG